MLDLNMKTFDEWWEENRVVKRGEKGLRQDGKVFFSEKQTRRVNRRGPGENTFDGWYALGRQVRSGEKGRVCAIRTRQGFAEEIIFREDQTQDAQIQFTHGRNRKGILARSIEENVEVEAKAHVEKAIQRSPIVRRILRKKQ